MIYGKKCPVCGICMTEVHIDIKQDGYQCINCGHIEKYDKKDDVDLVVFLLIILVIMGFLL